MGGMSLFNSLLDYYIVQLYNCQVETVVDTNIFLAVALNEPCKRKIVKATKNTLVIAPAILPYEIGNALSAIVKRKQVSRSAALKALIVANNIPVRLIEIDIEAALILAFENDLYAYDAYFLQCARTMSSPLLTLDKRLAKVATDLNINVLEI